SVTTMAPIQKWATTKMSTAARRPTASTVMRTASITTWCFGIGLVVTARSQMLGGGLLHGGDDRVPLGAGLAGDGDEVVHAEDAGHARSLKYRFGKGISGRGGGVVEAQRVGQLHVEAEAQGVGVGAGGGVRG